MVGHGEVRAVRSMMSVQFNTAAHCQYIFVTTRRVEAGGAQRGGGGSGSASGQDEGIPIKFNYDQWSMWGNGERAPCGEQEREGIVGISNMESEREWAVPEAAAS